ncbi:MAG: thiolase family protein [Deltaproteobacteria bacterium]|nr:thiolase family protein [Deltaproteobacteria bacterium]
MPNAVIVSAVRSAVGKAKKGSFINTRIDDMAAIVVKEAVARVKGLDPAEIEDVIMGCAMPEGEQGMNVAKIVAFLAGLHLSVAGTTVNRFCGSSLQTINMAAQAIMAGCGDVQVAAGCEHMTHVPMGGFSPSFNPKFTTGDYPEAYIPMGMTAENLAEKYSIGRQAQDEYAAWSHEKASKAIEQGLFKKEIVPIEVEIEGQKKIVTIDETVRPGTTAEKLSTLQPVFKEGGSVTAGNSSPLNDAAAACVLMSEERAKALGISPYFRIKAMAVAGCDPALMGIGPVPAVQKVLKRAAMTFKDIDVIELNEAFAVQNLAVIQEGGWPKEKINPRGGGVSIGHPLGATGARIMATLVHEMIDNNWTIGLETMCIGGGQGIATIIERVR